MKHRLKPPMKRSSLALVVGRRAVALLAGILLAAFAMESLAQAQTQNHVRDE